MTQDLKTIFSENMRCIPCVETAEGEIYLEPSEDGKHIVYGGVCNCGVIPSGEVEYDFDMSFEWNIQEVCDTILEEFGYPEFED